MTKYVQSGTKHSVDRMEERLNLKSTERMSRQIKLARERGYGNVDTMSAPKKIMKYINAVESKSEYQTKVKVYNNAVYVFGANDVLITVWKLGKELSFAYECARRKANKRNTQ